MTVSRRDLLALVGVGVLALAAVNFAHSPSEHDNTPSRSGEATPEQHEVYPEHTHIPTTVFWVGEAADASNDFIDNHASAWNDDWVKAFGGVDNPNARCGYAPCGVVLKENPFYFALPFGDYTEEGPKPPEQLKVIPWYKEPLKDGESILKNRWIEITFRGKKVYAQWEDVGPILENDADYVFGTDRPKEEARSGLDVSPAVADYLGLDGKGNTTWRFVEEADVPDGPWKNIVTRSGPKWGT